MSKLDQLRALREQRFNNITNNVRNEKEQDDTLNVTNKRKPVTNRKRIQSNAERQKRWREANLELSRAQARERMRKIRAAQKANAAV